MYYYNGGSMKKMFFLLCFFICINVSASNKFSVKLDKCIDGDTARFFINGESKIVRFLSINAPEIQHDDVLEEYYGNESSEYTCNILKSSKSIKLQYDSKSDKTDKYDRVLAWVFVDGELLQKKLVSNGYAEVRYVYDDYLYANDLKELESAAKEKKLGMWSDDIPVENKSSISNSDLIWYFFILVVSYICVRLVKYIFKR